MPDVQNKSEQRKKKLEEKKKRWEQSIKKEEEAHKRAEQQRIREKQALDASNKERAAKGLEPKKLKPDYLGRWEDFLKLDLPKFARNKGIRKERRSARKGVAKARLRFQETEDLLEDLNEGDGGPIYKFFWANELRFKIIAESVVTVPVEFAFHFLVTIGPFITMTAVGVVWVLVWMSVEHIALHAK